ncbi:MAG: bifunctional adenosylcobinamide kinase/adenosylcobinamide-phosphate guanylyltransferase [Bacteroidales bacterium]|nr:bifunctional adenosylcobinamide kinase/adenosylcobinamide-phosphate guanylyltransferase [Bacteroidales bacterium]
MARTLNLSTIYSKKFTTIELKGIFGDVFGTPEDAGAWLVFGSEKNGKTWFALKLAAALSETKRTLYISGEEGLGKDFVENCKRAKLSADNRNLHFSEYIDIVELQDKLNKRRSPEVVVIDNVTVYKDDLAYGNFRRLIKNYPNKLFIFLAHEERNEPYTATAKLIRKLSKVIIHIVGLKANISGRVPGGSLIIDEEKAQLFHSTKITE